MPSGTMSISHAPNSFCEGYESTSAGSIVVRYDFERGTQQAYHPNPGTSHGSAHRTAYLPNTSDGMALLQRLLYAFAHGLTFTVGTSLTSGAANAVTWAAIHHKTSLRGGVLRHGFPHANFFANCHAELDALGVPAKPAVVQFGSTAAAAAAAATRRP